MWRCFVHHQHDGVISGNGTQNGGTLSVVDVVGHAAGISGPGTDDGNIARNWSETNPLVISISLALWSFERLYMMLLGSTYTYLPFMFAAFATFSCFKSRDKVACVSSKPSLLKACNSSSWELTSLLEIIILMASNRLAFFLHFLYNYSKSSAKLGIISERICKKESFFILFIHRVYCICCFCSLCWSLVCSFTLLEIVSVCLW